MTKRKMAFCAYIAQGENATQAGLLAGYNKSTGSKLLKQPDTQEMINRLVDKQVAALALDSAVVLNRYAAVALTDPHEFLVELDDGDWRWKKPSELTAKQHMAVADIKMRKGSKDKETGKRPVTFSYVFHAKGPALDSLARYFDMYHEQANARAQGNPFRDLPADQLAQFGKLFEQLKDQSVVAEQTNGEAT